MNNDGQKTADLMEFIDGELDWVRMRVDFVNSEYLVTAVRNELEDVLDLAKRAGDVDAARYLSGQLGKLDRLIWADELTTMLAVQNNTERGDDKP